MPGCLVSPRPCGEKPQKDPPPAKNKRKGKKASRAKSNTDIVTNFVNKLWNREFWEEEERREFRDRLANGQTFLPRSVMAALSQGRSSRTVRHRQDQDGQPIWASGPDDYRKCVSEVYALVPDLKVTVLGTVANGDYVCAQLLLEGTNTNGAFGWQPDGKEFSVQTSALFLVKDRVIREDWLVYPKGLAPA